MKKLTIGIYSLLLFMAINLTAMEKPIFTLRGIILSLGHTNAQDKLRSEKDKEKSIAKIEEDEYLKEWDIPSLPLEVWEKIVYEFLYSNMQEPMEVIFKNNITTTPFKIGSLIKKHFSDCFIQLIKINPSTKLLITDVYFQKNFKAEYARKLKEYITTYKFYEVLKNQLFDFMGEDINLMKKEDYSEEDYLATFKILALGTDLYKQPKPKLCCFATVRLNDIIAKNEEDVLSDVFKFFIQRPNVDINSKNWGFWGLPLVIAAIYGNVFVVKFLLMHPQIDVNKKNKQGMSAFAAAVQAAYLPSTLCPDLVINVIKFLLSDPRVDIMTQDNEGQTVLDRIKDELDEIKQVADIMGWNKHSYKQKERVEKVKEILLPHYKHKFEQLAAKDEVIQ